MKKNVETGFGARLRRLLTERNLLAAELGRALGLSHVAIGNYLKGRMPRVDELARIARYFRISMDELVAEDQERVDVAPPDRRAESGRLDALAAAVERLRTELNDAEHLLTDARQTFKSLEMILALGPDTTRADAEKPAGRLLASGSIVGVSSTVAAVAQAGATAALAAAAGPVRGSSRSREAGVPSVRKRGPGRAAGQDSR